VCACSTWSFKDPKKSQNYFRKSASPVCCGARSTTWQHLIIGKMVPLTRHARWKYTVYVPTPTTTTTTAYTNTHYTPTYTYTHTKYLGQAQGYDAAQSCRHAFGPNRSELQVYRGGLFLRTEDLLEEAPLNFGEVYFEGNDQTEHTKRTTTTKIQNKSCDPHPNPTGFPTLIPKHTHAHHTHRQTTHTYTYTHTNTHIHKRTNTHTQHTHTHTYTTHTQHTHTQHTHTQHTHIHTYTTHTTHTHNNTHTQHKHTHMRRHTHTVCLGRTEF